MDERFEHPVTVLRAAMCQALADPLRIRIVLALSARPMYVTELAEDLRKPQSTVSRHLRTLRDARIVLAERDGVKMTYSLADARVVDALNIMGCVLRDAMDRDASLIP